MHIRQCAQCQRFIVRAQDFMQEVFSTTSYPWQLEIIVAHLCMMQIPRSSVSPAPVLLVHPTGSSKSCVRDVYFVMYGVVSLIITSLLSLGANQQAKIKL
jgi:hypothetical protein